MRLGASHVGRKLLVRPVDRYNPVEIMAHNRGDVWRALGCGAAMAALAALACLAFVASRDAPTLSLSELARTESIVMSCDDAPLPSAEPLWCADPNSPQCSPAAPDAPRIELSDRVDLWFPDAVALAPVRVVALNPWPASKTDDRVGRLAHARLERPPRG